MFDTQEEAAAEYVSVSKQAKIRKLCPFDSVEEVATTLKELKVKRHVEIHGDEQFCTTIVSTEDAQLLTMKLRLGQITCALLQMQMSDSSEQLKEADVQHLHTLVEEQIHINRLIMGTIMDESIDD